MPTSPIPIIYIDSLGHSGSTLLTMLIGEHPAVFSVGELNLANSRVMQKPCACGVAPVYACPFWTRVEELLQTRHGLSLRTVQLRSPDRDDFRRHNAALFAILQEVSGLDYILESSKDIARCLRLAREPDLFRVYPIFLKRHLPGVVASYKKKAKSPWSIYVHHNLRCFFHYKYRRYASCLVEYEELSRRPVESMTRIMGSVGLQFQESQLRWSLATRHSIGGNHMRLKQDTDIVLDEAWKTTLSRFEKLCSAVFSLPGACFFHAARRHR